MTKTKYAFLLFVGLILLLISLSGCTTPIEPIDSIPILNDSNLNPPEINNTLEPNDTINPNPVTQPPMTEPDPITQPSDPIAEPETPNTSTKPPAPIDSAQPKPIVPVSNISLIPTIVKISASNYQVTSDVNYSPDKTIDNDYSENSRWSAEGEQWLQLEFKEETSINNISIYYLSRNRTNYFQLAYSLDGASWLTIGNFASQSTADWFETFTFEPITAKYLRYLGSGNSETAWNSLIEIKFTNIPAKIETVCAGSETQNCNIENGFGTQSRTCTNGVWSTWSTCTATSCNNGYDLQNNDCIMETQSDQSLSAYCDKNSFIPQTVYQLQLKSAADYSKIVYIDPTHHSAGDGSSPSSPLKSWNDVVIESNAAYLQKRGTSESFNKVFNVRRLDNILIGSYGDGAKPHLTSTLSTSGDSAVFDFRGSTKITIRDISLSTTVNPSAIRLGNFYSTRSKDIMIYNVSIDTTSYGGIRIFSTDGVKILHTLVKNIPTDGIYVGDSSNIEIGYTKVEKVNTRWEPPTTSQEIAPGDSIQFNTVSDWYVHNNILDRSDTGNKFAFIANEQSNNGVLECNTLKGPMRTSEGGSTIYLGSGQNNLIIRYNHVVGPTHSSIYSHSVVSFHNNILEGEGASKITCSGCDVKDNIILS